jgi:hypothetical protein
VFGLCPGPLVTKNIHQKKTIPIFTVLILSNYEKNTISNPFSISSLHAYGAGEGNSFQAGCQG